MISRTASLLTAAILLTACVASPAPGDGESAAQEGVQEAAEQLIASGHTQLHGHLIPQSAGPTHELYELGAEGWLTWAMALPFSTGPLTDTTGAACAQGQAGPVWYLAGTTGGPVTRSCAVPKGKLLFIPLIDNWVIATADKVATPEQMARYIAFVNSFLPASRTKTCELHLRIDGADVGGDDTAELDQNLWTQVLDPFSVVLDDDNFGSSRGTPGGVAPAATIAGHFALISPLSKGDHVIEFGGSICNAAHEVTFETSAVYNITVD